MSDKIAALRFYLKLDDEAVIEQNKFDNAVFTVNPRQKLMGLSPEDIKAEIKWFRKMLDRFFMDHGRIAPEQWTSRFLQEMRQAKHSLYSYNAIAMKIKVMSPNAYSGLWRFHDSGTPFLDVLAYVSNTDSVFDSYHEAFDGLPIVDRRVPYWTNDGEYLVLSPAEVTIRVQAELDRMFQGTIMELPLHLRKYIDADAWHRDMKPQTQERLAPYDGLRHIVTYDNKGYVIYRQG